MAEREKEADIDPLTPYLARMFGIQFQHIKDPLSMREATLVREQCVNDFRARQLARQLLVQERFDKVRYEEMFKCLQSSSGLNIAPIIIILYTYYRTYLSEFKTCTISWQDT